MNHDAVSRDFNAVRDEMMGNVVYGMGMREDYDNIGGGVRDQQRRQYPQKLSLRSRHSIR